MIWKEVEAVAEKLDITPVGARKLLVLREKLVKAEEGMLSKIIVKLDPAKELDARVMEAMGWWPGGLK